MAAIQDSVLTFYPKMHYVPQRKLRLLMPVYTAQNQSLITEQNITFDYY